MQSIQPSAESARHAGSLYRLCRVGRLSGCAGCIGCADSGDCIGYPESGGCADSGACSAQRSYMGGIDCADSDAASAQRGGGWGSRESGSRTESGGYTTFPSGIGCINYAILGGSTIHEGCVGAVRRG
jgi:hypothetical protein